jgi:hypothetical protein
LHQDSTEEFGDEWNAVRQFCADGTKAQIIAAADELNEILDRFHDEVHLQEVADRLGSSYYPPGAGQTYRGWMIELERFLRTASTARSD